MMERGRKWGERSGERVREIERERGERYRDRDTHTELELTSLTNSE